MFLLRRRPSRIGSFLLGVAAVVAAAGVVVVVRALPTYHQRNASRWAKVRFDVIKPFLRTHAVAAELGALKGDFSRLIVRELQPERLHLVDPWYLQGTAWSWEKEDRSTVSCAERRAAGFRGSARARPGRARHRLRSRLPVATLPDAYFDWIYLDTTHTYEQTRLELELLQKKVKPSGVIAGDDWQPDPAHPHHGVYKAVQEVIADGKYRILYADAHNLQWAIGRVDRASPSAAP